MTRMRLDTTMGFLSQTTDSVRNPEIFGTMLPRHCALVGLGYAPSLRTTDTASNGTEVLVLRLPHRLGGLAEAQILAPSPLSPAALKRGVISSTFAPQQSLSCGE